MLKHSISKCPSIAQASCSEQCKLSNARTYVTYVLTKNYSPLGINLALGNARRGAVRFTQLRTENSRSAAASRQAVTHA